MGKKFWVISMILILSLSGCYYFSATKEMKNAGKMIAELKAAGGEKLVPYEYCSAESFLAIAKLEADQNDWKHAKDFAIRSKSAAASGLEEVQKKKK